MKMLQILQLYFNLRGENEVQWGRELNLISQTVHLQDTSSCADSKQRPRDPVIISFPRFAITELGKLEYTSPAPCALYIHFSFCSAVFFSSLILTDVGKQLLSKFMAKGNAMYRNRRDQYQLALSTTASVQKHRTKWCWQTIGIAWRK